MTDPAVVCGDFNVDRDSVLLRGFLSLTGLADVGRQGVEP